MNRITDYKKLQDDIVAWIKDYATTNNIKSLVVGVSGGIDSAVVSTLCAMTGIKTYCCILPIHSSNDHTKLAHTHINWLRDMQDNAHKLIIPLSNVYEAFRQVMPGEPFITDHSYANSKSRLRMTALYQIAAPVEGIVIGTGNKVEDFGVGFYTKYGDGGVDISPIADLYKTEVRELGRYMGISQEILDAAPTDGLWTDGRTDEQQIGATYEELEWAMENLQYIDINTSDISPFFMVDQSKCTPRQMEVVGIYADLHMKNQHKMLPIPIYKLTI
jgi:NAD+ synthase